MPNLVTSNPLDAFMQAANIAAMRTALRDPLTPVTITFANPLNPDCADGLYRKVTMTGDMEINPPTNGADGDKWKCRLLASGGARTLTLDAAIVVPSESSFTSKVIASGKTYFIQMEYTGSAWWLQSLEGGY